MTDKKTTLPIKRKAKAASKSDASYSGNMSLSVSLSPEQGLNRYLQEVRKYPMLEKDEEFMLAKRWVEHQDSAAAEKWSPRIYASWLKSPWDIAVMACPLVKSFPKAM